MNRLKELRSARNLSLEALAEELSTDTEMKVNKMQLSRYERGENNPKAETWEYIASYFDVSVPYLMGYEESRNAEELDSWLEKSIEKMANEVRGRIKEMYDHSAASKDVNYDNLMDMIEKDSQEKLIENQQRLLLERYEVTGELPVFEKWKELVYTNEHENSEQERLETNSLIEMIQHYHGKISASSMKTLMEFHQILFEVRRDLFDLDNIETESLLHHYASLLRVKERS